MGRSGDVFYLVMVMMEGKMLWWADCERDGGAQKWGTFYSFSLLF